MDETYDSAQEAASVKRPGLLVISAGIATSLGTLALLYVLDQVTPDFNVMGWYANYILPVGAILVGAAAGSGYGLASWLSGAKIGKGLMVQVLLLQVGCYFLAQYVGFLLMNVPPGITFWQYFDFVTRAFAWNKHGQAGQPFGAWGYAMRALEIAGFSFSGLIAPGILFSVPYCDACQIYMRTKELGWLPAGIVPRTPKKKDVEANQAYINEQKAALEAGKQLVEALLTTVGNKEPRQFAELLHRYSTRKKEICLQTSRTGVSLQHCRCCLRGRVVLRLNSGQGDQIAVTELGHADLDPDFVQAVMLHRDELRAS